jgi:hypothetical protein
MEPESYTSIASCLAQCRQTITELVEERETIRRRFANRTSATRTVLGDIVILIDRRIHELDEAVEQFSMSLRTKLSEDTSTKLRLGHVLPKLVEAGLL